jgi:hypothetical protein
LAVFSRIFQQEVQNYYRRRRNFIKYINAGIYGNPKKIPCFINHLKLRNILKIKEKEEKNLNLERHFGKPVI